MAFSAWIVSAHYFLLSKCQAASHLFGNAQASLFLTWSGTPNTGFLVKGLIYDRMSNGVFSIILTEIITISITVLRYYTVIIKVRFCA